MAISTRVVITKDDVAKTFASLTQLSGKQVLVGIPESKNHREAVDNEQPLNNAAIGYLMEFGSPSNNVPARAFLVPGVQKAEGPALAKLKEATAAALDGNQQKSDQNLNAAGILAMNSARQEIGSNIPPPLSPSTIAGRPRARGAKSLRASEKKYFELLDQGIEPGNAQSQTGIISLINSGSLRNSITYVVRTKK